MKVAVATSDGKKVNLHFGSAEIFLIFKIEENGVKFLEMREKPKVNINNHSDRWAVSLKLLKDCDALFCDRIGVEPKEALQKEGIDIFESQKSINDAFKDYFE
ncbi:NifB/NifX family molybdenum-iron cluster-binding protein [Methanobacterium sp. ACI-7]|uniref:NifB/NifX family molybdenum-iron cluster-binding protein n=1 Tax=unclassified Methanobacterium TaxID=2627676 RepID=UPI0039C21265